MEVEIHDEKKLVEIWLTNAEKNDPQVKGRLQSIYDYYGLQKYRVAVFESGGQDLHRSVRDLLVYNKRRCAELAVRLEKETKGASM